MSTYRHQVIDVKKLIVEDVNDDELEARRSEKNNEKKEKRYESVLMHGDGVLDDNDRFKVTLINDIYSKFMFEKINDAEGQEFIEKYNYTMENK